MIHLYDRATIAGALTLHLDPSLRRLLAERIDALTDELLDHTEYLVVEPGDTEAEIVRAVGFSPLVEPFEGARFGTPAFWPHWDWLANHGGIYELIESFGSSFAYVLLIREAEGVPADLLALCRTYAGR